MSDEETNGDPGRRSVIRALAALGVAAVTTIGVRSIFRDHPPEPSAPPTTQPPVVPRTAPSSTTTAAAPTGSSTLPTTPPPSMPEPLVVDVISKVGWEARPAGEFVSHRPSRLTFHHTASGSSDPAGAPARIREYQRYHQAQGWADVAYHFVIDQAGRIYEGRPVTARGDTFTEYDPTDHFLPCLDGNFDVDSPSIPSIAALIQVLAWAAQRFEIDPASLTGHRDHAATTCPGSFAYELRDEIAEQVASLVATGQPVELRMVDRIPDLPA